MFETIFAITGAAFTGAVTYAICANVWDNRRAASLFAELQEAWGERDELRREIEKVKRQQTARAIDTSVKLHSLANYVASGDEGRAKHLAREVIRGAHAAFNNQEQTDPDCGTNQTNPSTIRDHTGGEGVGPTGSSVPQSGSHSLPQGGGAK